MDEYLKNQVSLEASKETDEHKVELMMDAHLKTLQAMKEKYMEVEGYRHELGMKAREDMMKKQMEMDEHRTNLELRKLAKLMGRTLFLCSRIFPGFK